MKNFALILAANLVLSGVCLASPPKFGSHTSVGIKKFGGNGGTTISGSGNGTGNTVYTPKTTFKVTDIKVDKKITGSGNGTGNSISVGSSPKLFLPKGVTKVNTTFDSKTNTGFKQYQYNGKTYKAQCFGSGFKNWSKWCWYSKCGCYCYWAPSCNCWCYWYQPWCCYLPVECTVIFPPDPNDEGPDIDDDDMDGPGGPGPGGAPVYSVGANGPPGLPQNPNVDLPVAPGPQDLVPISGKKS
jgi:hypothetical protein